MKLRVVSIFLILIGFSTFVECRKCFNSLESSDEFDRCPASRPKCCGTKKNGHHAECARSCVRYKCETNYDCDGLGCCSGHCSDKKNCLPVTTWGVVGIAIVCLFFVLAMFRTCQWCHKRKLRRQQRERSSNEQANQSPPFVVSNFDNHGFSPMAPPPYESIIQSTRSRTDDHSPIYNLNLQTVINNSSTNGTGSNNLVHEVNISIRGSNMFSNDFPPSYSEVTGDDSGAQLPSYTSSQRSVESLEQLEFSDEPPPYSSVQESQNITTTNFDTGEVSTLQHNDAPSGELHPDNVSLTEADNEQPAYQSSNDHEITPNISTDEHAIVTQEERISPAELSDSSTNQNSSTDTQTTFTRL